MEKQDDQVSVKLSVMLHREGPVYYLYIINLSCLLTNENVKYIFWNKRLWFHNEMMISLYVKTLYQNIHSNPNT